MICAVIPTLNNETSLPPLLEQLRPDVERIVVTDGGSEDRTHALAIAHKAVIAAGGKGRGQQLGRGAVWSGDCDWLLVLHADCTLYEGAFNRIYAHIRNYPDKAGYFDLRFDSPGLAARILEILVRVRCTLFGLPYGDQGLLIPKNLYDDIGGYEPISLFEDVALIRSLGKHRLRRLGLPITTQADKYERDGFYRRGWRNFRLLRKYLKGTKPEELLKDYA